jgi:hypothetical protein
MLVTNPFQVGGVITSPANFINHQREIRYVGSNLLTGQSSAITGEPRSGKSSLLYYLKAESKRAELYGEQASLLHFAYLDAHTFGGNLTATEFWKLAFTPLAEIIQGNSVLCAAYKSCEFAGFANTQFETLLEMLQSESRRLVVMIDEFDAVLYHPQLNRPEFYGTLRSMASRFPSLVIILASRRSVGHFNSVTQALKPKGSPYFNFLNEIAMQPFKSKFARALAQRAENKFDAIDQDWLWKVAGGHPYLLQAAASALWNIYQDGEGDPVERRKEAGKILYQQVAPTLDDTWCAWSPDMKKAFTIAGLDNLPALLDPVRPQRFDIERMLKSLPEYAPELRALETRGFVIYDASLSGKWKIQAEVMLWWLTEALVHAIREGDGVGRWLQADGWENLLQCDERESLFNAAKAASNLPSAGVESLSNYAACIDKDKRETLHPISTSLVTARRALGILEQQAAGHTSLTIPAHLQIELEDKRREVADLEKLEQTK